MDAWNLRTLFKFSTETSVGDSYQIQNTKTDDKDENSRYHINLLAIIQKYRECIDRGEILEGINFLEYHYKFTKHKKKYLRFIKYFIHSKSWMTNEAKSRNTLDDDELLQWIKAKERKLKNPKRMILLAMFFLLLIVVALKIDEYRDLIIGAIIGILATLIGKTYEKMIE